MPFCPKCGTSVEGNFCPQCGSAVGWAAPAASAGSASSTGGMTDNVAGALCYLLGFITGILFLVLAPYNQNRLIRFHAFQSIFLSAALMVLHFAIGILLPWSVSLILSPLLSLAGFVLWLFLMWKTYQNQRVLLPFIGPLAERQS